MNDFKMGRIMWRFLAVGIALMVAGLVVRWFVPDVRWYYSALVGAGAVVALAGLIAAEVWERRREREEIEDERHSDGQVDGRDNHGSNHGPS